MGKGQQDLNLTAKTEGFDKAAADVGKVADAKGALKDKVEAGGKATGDAVKSQEKLNASESDYVGILSQINPALGGLVDGFLKSGKVAGDLASQNINLGDAFKKATAAIKGNAAALKLLGAGGLVVLAIFAIVKALEKMRQEAEAATKALKAQTDALNELQNQRKDRGQAIENISDSRRIGGFNADQARRATSTAQSIGEQFEGLSPDAINQVVGLAFDAGLSKEQLTQAAFLQQTPGRLDLNENMSAEGIKRAIEGAIRRNTDAIAKFFGREKMQGQGLGISGERLSDAMRELDQEGGSTVALQDALESFAPEGTDLGKLAIAARGIRETGGFVLKGPAFLKNAKRRATPRELGLGPGETLSDAERQFAESLVERIIRATNVQASGGTGGGTTITINDNTVIQHNGKYRGVGAQGRRKPSRRELIES